MDSVSVVLKIRRCLMENFHHASEVICLCCANHLYMIATCMVKEFYEIGF